MLWSGLSWRCTPASNTQASGHANRERAWNHRWGGRRNRRHRCSHSHRNQTKLRSGLSRRHHASRQCHSRRQSKALLPLMCGRLPPTVRDGQVWIHRSTAIVALNSQAMKSKGQSLLG